MAAKKKRKVVKKQTLAEFRAWLSGIELIQPDDWSPTVEQWNMIRAQIDKIVEPEPQAPAHAPSFPQPQYPPVQPMQQPPAGVAPMPTPTLSGAPAEADIEMTPAARAILEGGASGKHKTPNIDSSNGNYDSSFT